MTPLDVPVPPQLEQAVGLPETEARWFAIYWQPCGDESVYDDGHLSGTGNWTGYLAYVQHPAVALALAPYNLGSSDAEAAEWLLVDRHGRKAYVGPAREAARVLREQWPAQEPVVLSDEEWRALAARLDEEFASRPVPTMEDVEAAMQQRLRVEAEMVEWLDATPQAAQAREAIRRMVRGGTEEV